MPKPDGMAPISLDAMLAEIDAIKAEAKHHLALDLTRDQEAVLLRAAPGTAGGLPWFRFMAFWEAQGWPGCEGTLRKKYRALVAGDG